MPVTEQYKYLCLFSKKNRQLEVVKSPT